jgi:hypothetical protein
LGRVRSHTSRSDTTDVVRYLRSEYEFDEAVESMGLDDLVAEWAPGLAVVQGLTEERARARVRELLSDTTSPRNDAEDRFLWEIWKDIRPQ